MSNASLPREAQEELARFSDFPGVRPPDRRRDVDSHGVRLAVSEWGDASAPPLLLAHGGFDFSGTFGVFAPLLADGGFRVVSWDQRGHGDSAHAVLYSWDSDVRDALSVLDTISREPVPLVGHSKGASLLTTLTHALPHRVRRLVNIDGMPSRGSHPDIADHERTRMRAGELAEWLDHRRRCAELKRKPGSLEELARRRARMNPRLSHEWLCYLAAVGARYDADGWRWKIDPVMRFGGFGPFRPDWELKRLSSLSVPLLGMLAGVTEEMGWENSEQTLANHLPDDATLRTFEKTGHFIHIERPREVADLVLEFLS